MRAEEPVEDVREPSDFANEGNLRSWLEGTPIEWQQVLSTRSLLRVLPIILDVLDLPGPELPQKLEKRLVLNAFRAAHFSWAAQWHPISNSIEQNARAAAEAVSGASNAAFLNSAAAKVAGAAASTAALFGARPKGINTSAAAVNWHVGLSSSAISHAIAAGVSQMPGSEATILKSVAADAQVIAKARKVDAVMRKPLWLIEVRAGEPFNVNFPDWVRKSFDAFANSDLTKGSPWGEWVAWYRAILPNKENGEPRSYFGLEADIALMTQSAEFWNRDPDAVMADIAEMRRSGPNRSSIKNSGKAQEVDVGATSSVDAAMDTPPPARQDHAVATHSDEPTSMDELGRRPFARALVERMDDVRRNGGEDGFAIHLHAPWGAGKTSVLLMMDEIMSAPEREAKDRWIAVHFNAWRFEDRKPPWWPLLQTIKSQSIERLKSWWPSGAAICLRFRWLWWKVWSDWVPYVLALLAFPSFAFLAWTWLGSIPRDDLPNVARSLFAILASLAAAFGTFVVAARIVVFGSSENAKFYAAISRDPLKRIVKLFNDMIDSAGRPVCVFIDDIDRCHADYVVDLLSGIQSSFRHRNVVYVVAADRGWIKSSFESQYGQFVEAVGDTGQPLGYLFWRRSFKSRRPFLALATLSKRAIGMGS